MGSYAYSQHVDESSEEEDDFSLSGESEAELDILRPSTHALGLSKRYVTGWTCQDAFREFYQNW